MKQDRTGFQCECRDSLLLVVVSARYVEQFVH